MPFRIKESAELWRLVMSLYINFSFAQLVINCLGQMIAGFMLEAQMGSLRLMCFWFAAGICANLFAATVDDFYAAGAEPALFAMLGGLIAMYCYYWDRLGTDEDWCRKVCGLFMMVFLLVIGIVFLVSFAQPYKNWAKFYRISYPDPMGYLGGFLFGFPMSWIFFAPTGRSLKLATKREKMLFYVGIGLASVLLFIIVVSFAFGSEPDKYWEYE